MTEKAARLLAIALALGVPSAALVGRGVQRFWADDGVVEIRGTMSEQGGWTPAALTATVGEPLRLRLTSDDVMHGFAIGHVDSAPVDVKPGEVTEFAVTFSRPGRYMFYCTRWCGLNHWRMRGTIEVAGGAQQADSVAPPRYAALGLDLDAPHPAEMTPSAAPSTERAEELAVIIPETLATRDYYREHSPVDIWRSLRRVVNRPELTDQDYWDLVALIWLRNSPSSVLARGERIYSANCAACHGEAGGGDGVMADALTEYSESELGQAGATPADFTNAAQMLGASPVLLLGKIVRGGMGTGMPYWGPILTDAQIWAVVHYLWTFQFEGGVTAGVMP
jgi:mono/diheme cytochrome c family protein/plastocyanin